MQTVYFVIMQEDKTGMLLGFIRALKWIQQLGESFSTFEPYFEVFLMLEKRPRLPMPRKLRGKWNICH